MNRGFRNGQNTTNSPEQPAPQASSNTQTASTKRFGSKLKGGQNSNFNLKNAGGLTFMLALLILVAGVIFALITFKGNYTESKYVDTTKYQAVFLNGGQVYFGNIDELNSKYLKLDNIYYLRVNQQVQPDGNAAANGNDVSLVKLGCELHGPQDSMVVNREQIIFWENLKDNGQVVEAINKYREQYPQGEDCKAQGSTNTNTNNTSTESNTTPSGSTNTNTLPATNNTTNTTPSTRP